MSLKLSIVVPSFNQAAFLEKALVSIFGQGIEGIDVLVMDGGSNDASLDVIMKYSQVLSYWQSQPDGGQTAALNAGIARAEGDIICWLNSDDMYAPGSLKVVAQRFNREPELDLLVGDRAYINEASQIIGWESRPTYDPLTMGYSIWSEAAFFKKSLWERLGGFDESLNCVMDIDFFLRAVKVANYKRVRRILGYFRLQENQKTQSLSEQCKEEGERIWGLHTNLPTPGPIHVGRLDFWNELLRNPRALALPYAKSWLARKLRC